MHRLLSSMTRQPTPISPAKLIPIFHSRNPVVLGWVLNGKIMKRVKPVLQELPVQILRTSLLNVKSAGQQGFYSQSALNLRICILSMCHKAQPNPRHDIKAYQSYKSYTWGPCEVVVQRNHPNPMALKLRHHWPREQSVNQMVSTVASPSRLGTKRIQWRTRSNWQIIAIHVQFKPTSTGLEHD